MKTINVGIIGYGMAGELFHAPYIANTPGLQIKSIRTTNPELIAKAKKRYPEVQIVPTTDSLIQDPDIDLIVVASPNQFHFEQVRSALLAGKHVVVDKPFTETSLQAGELNKLATERGKVLSVFQNRRWDSDFQTVRQIVESGRLGKIVEAEIHFDRFRNYVKEGWKEENAPGTGLLYDLGSHLIDQALVLFGVPVSITADVRTLRPEGKIIDYFDVRLSYASGMVAILKSSMLVKQPGPKYTINGMKGSFVKYGQDIQEKALLEGLVPSGHSAWGEEPVESWGTLSILKENQEIFENVPSIKGDYSGFYHSVYQAIASGKANPVPAHEALKTIRLIELALESSHKRCTIDVSF